MDFGSVMDTFIGISCDTSCGVVDSEEIVMAERIILTIDDGYCQEKCSCFPIACSAECEHLDKPTFSYTRQEAIERMAKAIFKRDSVLALDIGFEDLIEQKQNVYRDFANVALNALLEDNNER